MNVDMEICKKTLMNYGYIELHKIEYPTLGDSAIHPNIGAWNLRVVPQPESTQMGHLSQPSGLKY